MRWLRTASLVLTALPAPSALVAQDTEIVVRGDLRRQEIERILAADNIDTSRVGARETADAMALIARGRAPEDFWQAYRSHVAAWQRFADLEAGRHRQGAGSLAGEDALMRADREIDRTFDDVERIARRYGARMPTPPWKRVPAA